MSSNDLLRYGVWVVLLLDSLIVSVAAPEETSVTVNSDSFLDIVTGKIDELGSKIDLLSISETGSKGHRMDPKIENQICSLSSRMIEMENEIDGLKSSHTVPLVSASSAMGREVPEETSDLQSKVVALQKSLEKEMARVTKLEKRFQSLQESIRYPFPEAEIELESKTCSFQNAVNKDIESLLVKVESNIFKGKPGNASSIHSTALGHQVFNAVDGDTTTYWHSAKGSNPWYFVDLETPHYIWEIRLTLREVTRGGGIKIYLANDAAFLGGGTPDVGSLPLFNNQERNSLFTTFIYKRSQGMCGRYVVIMREIPSEYLIINEIQGTGLAF